MRKLNKPMTFTEFVIRVVLIALCAIAIGLQSSCALLKGISPQDAFAAGQLTGAAYLDLKDVQPAQVTVAAQVAYHVLVRLTGGEDSSLLDDMISEELAKAGESATLNVIVGNYIQIAKDRLQTQLGTTDLNQAQLVLFREGIDSIIKPNELKAPTE